MQTQIRKVGTKNIAQQYENKTKQKNNWIATNLLNQNKLAHSLLTTDIPTLFTTSSESYLLSILGGKADGSHDAY